MFDRLDLNLLRVFAVLMEERSVSRAAPRLGLTQASASNALARLRLALGDRVLERQGNAMVPTRRALDLWPEVDRALAALRAAVEAEATFDPAGLDAEVTVGIDEYSLWLLGPALIADLRAAAPGLRLRLVPGWPAELSETLFEGPSDRLVGSVWQDLPGLRTAPLYEEDFVAVTADAAPLDRAAYVARPHLLYSLHGIVPGSLDWRLAQIGEHRLVQVAVPYLSAAPRLLPGTDLILNVGRRLGASLARDEGLAMHELPVPETGFAVAMVWHPRNDPSVLHRWLRDRLAAAVPRPRDARDSDERQGVGLRPEYRD